MSVIVIKDKDLKKRLLQGKKGMSLDEAAKMCIIVESTKKQTEKKKKWIAQKCDIYLSKSILDGIEVVDSSLDDIGFTEGIENISFIEPEYDNDDEQNVVEIKDFEIDEDHENLLKSLERNKFSDTIQNEGMKFIAGYVAYRFKDKFPTFDLGLPANCKVSSKYPDWIEFLSRGGRHRSFSRKEGKQSINQVKPKPYACYFMEMFHSSIPSFGSTYAHRSQPSRQNPATGNCCNTSSFYS
ncbi:unnamed protein product [Phaedon cochleariae]|uniref:Transposable element P transposase-like C-terminal domain-containing protein n=1 Tax=Phaedon cochleariae TaxID=80249 RepID=A0A9N9SAB1_PHACE|nr:unnamed protein product [Phaedon cochleariae]